MISLIKLILFLVACNNYATTMSPHCRHLVTRDHLKNLSDLAMESVPLEEQGQDMYSVFFTVPKRNRDWCAILKFLNRFVGFIDTQMKSSCQISFNYVEETDLNHHVCFLKAAYRPLGNLLRNEMKFKENTANYKIQEMLLESHDNLNEECFQIKADESQSSRRCMKKHSLSAKEMLQLVHRYFFLAEELIDEGKDFNLDCSSIFQKCSDSQNEPVTSSGVVTDQDCKCPATSPITRGLMTSFLPTFESLPSNADQLDSKEKVVSTLQLFMVPDTMQTQGQSEGSISPRVPRSTYKGPNIDFAVVAHTAEDLALAAKSQGPGPVAKDTFQDSPPSTHLWSPRPSNIPALPSRQQQTETALPGSGAGNSQTWPNEFSSQHLSLSSLAKFSPSKQWLPTRDIAKAVPGLASDLGRTDSSTSSLSLESSLESLDSSGVPSSGSWAVLSPSDPALSPSLGSEEPFSTTRQSFRESARQRSLITSSWGQQNSRSRAPGMQQSTQLREKRAGRGEEGMAKDRDPEHSLSGPNFDLSFIPSNTDKVSKKPELRNSQRMTVMYVLVPSVLGILLAVGGLLFYLHKSRMLARRQQLSLGNDMEEQEGSPLRGGEEHLELQMQGEL